jgi:hypothetical protein
VLAEGTSADAIATLAWLAGRDVCLDEELLHAARRRAMLLLAAGGDPLGGLALDGRAVSALAAELDLPERRAELAAGIARLREQATGLPLVADVLGLLRGDPDLAWRAFVCGLLAEELGEDY